MTVRWLLSLVGIEPANLAAWYVFGTPYHNSPGMETALDAVIPQPPAGVSPEIAFVAHGQPPRVSAQMAAPAAELPVAQFCTRAVAASPEAAKLLDRIDAEWQSSVTLERQLAGVRKKVGGILAKLNSLDKDLTPEERLHADNADVKDWQEARRWLRDVGNRAQRYVKEHDIGITSMAGRRRGFEETYATVIEPRRPVEGLEMILREFDSYRKSLQTLLNNMNNAYTTASQEGERRAQRVLSRIRAKARSGRSMVSRKKST